MMKVGGALGGSVAKGVGASFLPESSILKTVAKYVSMGTGALMIVLGLVIAIFDGRWIVGPIDVALGGFMLIVEFAIPFLTQFELYVMLFDYKVRAGYILFCIPAFFSVFTIVCGIGCIASGGIYAVLGFIKDEKAEVPKYVPQQDVEQHSVDLNKH